MVFIFGKFLNFRHKYFYEIETIFGQGEACEFPVRRKKLTWPMSIIYAQNTFFRSVFRYKRKRRLILKNDALHYPEVLLRSLYEAISKA